MPEVTRGRLRSGVSLYVIDGGTALILLGSDA